jgi:histidyl-tRNA synthetase
MIEAPKGTHDVLPAEAARRELLEQHARRILGGAGYRRIETPMFEATELFSRGVGASSDVVQKEMYTFADHGDRSLTLKPEGTAPICRAYIEHGMHKLPSPVKFWYLSPFFRYEAPQKGRQREFWQLGAEVIGAAGPEADAELIILLAELLEAMGVKGVRLLIGSLGTPATRAEYRSELTEFLRAHASALPAEVLARIELNPMRAFDSVAAAAVMADAPRLMDRLTAEDAEHFASVRGLLDGAGLAYEIDTTLVRGLDYYTRTLFEFSSESLGAQSGVGGGGRYDGLIEQLGGQPTPGAGWAAGVERILLAGAEQPIAPDSVDLYVVPVAMRPPSPGLPGADASGAGADASKAGADPAALAFELTREARRVGLAAQLELTGRSVKAALKHADRLGARYVALVGETVGLKDMESGEQTEVALADDVIHTILRGHRL